jgi:hypothetical protein
MATELGEVTSYKRLYLQFRDSVGKTINLTLNNPKNLDDGDYADLAAQDAAVEGVMDTIIAKNIFHNNGNDLNNCRKKYKCKRHKTSLSFPVGQASRLSI